WPRDWSSDVCSSDLSPILGGELWVLNKQQLLEAAPTPALRTIGPDPRDESLQPVRSLGASAVEYVASVDDPFSSVVHLLAVTGEIGRASCRERVRSG